MSIRDFVSLGQGIYIYAASSYYLCPVILSYWSGEHGGIGQKMRQLATKAINQTNELIRGTTRTWNDQTIGPK